MTVEIICLVLFTVICLGISITDSAVSDIPNWLSLGLLGVSLIYYFTHLSSKTWYFPLVASFGLLIICFIIFVLSGEAGIGGGDMKMLIISLLCMNSSSIAFNYLLWYSGYTLCGYIITRFIKNKRYMSCGPYYSLALISALFSNILTFKGYVVYVAFFSIITLLGSSFYYSKVGVPYEEVLF